MANPIVDIGADFYHRLANRDKFQGDGKNTAVEFRDLYLHDLDSADAWKSDDESIVLDFSKVTILIPSFANEAFAYFTKYAPPERILKKIVLRNISKIKAGIIEEELTNGYSR